MENKQPKQDITDALLKMTKVINMMIDKLETLEERVKELEK